MINIKLEIFLGNVSFIILFLIMVLHWIQAIFFIIPKFNLIIFLTTLLVNLSLLFLLILRWLNYKHFPLSNLYESLLFLSWNFTLIQLILGPATLKYETHLNKSTKKINFANINTIIGSIISPIALFTNGFATFSLPKTMQKAQALVPALQSNWLMMHVTVMMLSYTALLCGSLLAITFLIITCHHPKNFVTTIKQFFVKNELILPVKQMVYHLGTSYVVANKPHSKYKHLVPGAKRFAFKKAGFYNVVVKTLRNDNKIFCNLVFTNLKSEVRTKPFGSQNRYLAHARFPPLIENLITPSNRLGKQYKFEVPAAESHLPINYSVNFLQTAKNQQRASLAKILDNLSYRILGIGFPLLTIGILSGAVWANEAWGSYWSWDPKETWAFITWLIFAIYLHARIVKGWEGEKPAILASLGFFIVWICYLGVNLLGTGLHSYGWMQ